jgi:hypothetical protein
MSTIAVQEGSSDPLRFIVGMMAGAAKVALVFFVLCSAVSIWKLARVLREGETGAGSTSRTLDR